MNVGTATYER